MSLHVPIVAQQFFVHAHCIQIAHGEGDQYFFICSEKSTTPSQPIISKHFDSPLFLLNWCYLCAPFDKMNRLSQICCMKIHSYSLEKKKWLIAPPHPNPIPYLEFFCTKAVSQTVSWLRLKNRLSRLSIFLNSMWLVSKS